MFENESKPEKEESGLFDEEKSRGSRSNRPPRLSFESSGEEPRKTSIKVIGIGGAGCNAVENMMKEGFGEGIEFYAINTDFQALSRSSVPNRIQIGDAITSGTGAGSMPNIGEEAAREAEDELRKILEGSDLVFITAGMGGGTGTGAAPVVAEIARSMDILNVAIVTKPFLFEGSHRMRRAVEGIRKLGENVDTMITIMNDKLMEAVGAKTPLTEAFEIANLVLAQGIRAISDLIATPGLINVDFRDVRTIMGETGGAVMGVGEGKGENRAVEAVRKACHSPLQEKIVIDGARGVLINITGPPTITMHEVHEATTMVQEAADPDANVIFGVVIDENMQDSMRVTIIATGFNNPDLGESFGEEREDRLRPRQNQKLLTKANAAPASVEQSSSQAEPAKAPAQPAPQANGHANGSAETVRAQQAAPTATAAAPAAQPQARVMADSSPRAQATAQRPTPTPTQQATAPAEDPYEIPALQKRRDRRSRSPFFE